MSSHTTKGELTHAVGRTLSFEQIDIFSVPPPTSRRDDYETSKAAGEIFEGDVGAGLRLRVLEAFRLNGPMTAETAELLPAFSGCGASTIRKRISELKSMVPPKLVEYGEVRNRRGKRMKVWGIPPC